jgi:hypothetical protein
MNTRCKCVAVCTYSTWSFVESKNFFFVMTCFTPDDVALSILKRTHKVGVFKILALNYSFLNW